MTKFKFTVLILAAAFAPMAFAQAVSSSAPIFRTAGGFVMKWTGSGFTPLLKPGDALPGNRTLAYIGTLTTNRKGDFAFTAQTQGEMR